MTQLARSARVGVCLVAFLNLAIFAAPPANYYDTADATSSTTLRQSLHEIIDDHVFVRYTSTSLDTWDVLEPADEDPNNTSNILDVYKNASYVKVGGGTGSYNREHSWPKSYGFPEDSSTQINAAANNISNYPYTDCHHLFLCDIGYNSSRNNLPYDTCSAACSESPTDFNNGQGGGSGIYPGNSNWRTGSGNTGTWEAWIGRRGDVARALLYMDVRYDGTAHSLNGAAEPDLILTDNDSLIVSNTSSNQSVAYMGILTTLLQWHVDDPVDDQERQHHEAAYVAQSNRNPFIDHPEWVECVFNNNCTFTCTDPADCDDGLFCNGPEDCVGGTCQAGSDPCPGQSCDETTDTCFTPSGDPWINEIHYDNDSTDTGEFLEIAGPAGTSLNNWQVQGYNGNGGGTYSTLINLSGTIPDQGGCMGVLDFDFIPMQNGPDGLALLDDTGVVVQFISYEGSFAATNGPANGMNSDDIGVFEPTTTPVGQSLQLSGTGATYAEFMWQSPAVNTRGLPNAGQTFDNCGGCTDDTDCDDGLHCNGAETCNAASCVAGTPPNCDDGVACTDDACNELTDSCDNVANDGNCDDGAYCNGAETCDTVFDCQAGSAVDCDDGVVCTDDACNESTDSCDHVTNDANCDDGVYCNGAETCDQALDCQAGTAVNCDDGVGCTDDSCNESTASCEHVADDLNCDDGLFCNGSETCDSLNDCQAGSDPCPGQGCDDLTDTCIPTVCNNDGTCDAGEDCDNCPNDCPTLGADPNNGICETADGEDCITAPNDCNSKLNGNPGSRYCCGDGTAQYGVTCGDNRCTANGNTCSDLPAPASCCGDSVCEGAETIPNCAVDCAECTIAAECDDLDSCTNDDCIANACSNTPLDCDDADSCTDDTCFGGACFNDPIDCDDGDLCTIDSCNTSTGCINDPLDCDDADACTTDSCAGGTCFNDPLDCDDGEACTVDTCDTISGCNNAWPACGAADGCCGPACGPGNDPDCCGAGGSACSSNSDCCSNRCKGNGTCK